MVELAELGKIGGALVASGALGWVGNAAVEWWKNRGVAADARTAAEVDLEQHRDGLTFQLLAACRSEIAALTAQVDRLRPMEASFYDLQQALEHMDALLNSTADDRAGVERNARAFLNRMRRNAEARGTITNEVQRAASTARLMTDDLPPPAAA